MLQAVIYYIVTTILTKELVIAQCTIYHFESPGVSCEDIYNKNPQSHDTSGYYWVLDGPRILYCGMSYTGSSCEDIYSNNAETVIQSGYYRINDNQWTFCKAHAYNYTGSSCEDIYSTNPATRDKSGYYHINDSQWIYCIMTTVDAYNYTGSSSCEDIYNSNPETVIKSGYYRINYSQWSYCKVDMYNYTGSSCEHIYSTNPATRDRSGYYHINDTQWIYCMMTTADAYNYTGSSSCEDIFNSNPQTVIMSGYYRINYSQWTYCKVDMYNYTGSSCEDIYSTHPETRDKSGYYHINHSQWTYCNMTAITAIFDSITTCAGVGGVWIRIVTINISAGDDCPGEWRKATHSGVSFCRLDSDGLRTCSSASFSTNGISYQRVCGRARGYQKGDTVAFYGSWYNSTIDEDYVDGLSITYSSNPRQHIWTFASGRGERFGSAFNCPCSINGGFDPPSYVGSHYYCESGSTYRSDWDRYYFNDTLWDGAGCEDNCCDDTTQPWFYRQLNQATQDNIEARICLHGYESLRSTLIDQLELYIQ